MTSPTGVPTSMWQTLSLGGQTIEIFDPPEAIGDRVLLVLPGWEQRASAEVVLSDWLVRNRMRAVAPVAGSWWLDRVEPGFAAEQTPLAFLQDQILPWIEEQWQIVPPNIRLFGWEEGGQGALQLAFRRPRDFPSLAVIDAAIDFHEHYGQDSVITDLFPNREAARQETALLRLHPAGWPRRMLLIADRTSPWFFGVDRLDMKLGSMSIPVETAFYPGESATITDRAVAIDAALDYLGRESMGLPVVGRGD